MTWYRVLVEASGRYRGGQQSSDHVGLFTTRNLDATDETSARLAAIQAVRTELLDLEREGSSPSSISVINIRPWRVLQISDPALHSTTIGATRGRVPCHSNRASLIAIPEAKLGG